MKAATTDVFLLNVSGASDADSTCSNAGDQNDVRKQVKVLQGR